MKILFRILSAIGLTAKNPCNHSPKSTRRLLITVTFQENSIFGGREFFEANLKKVQYVKGGIVVLKIKDHPFGAVRLRCSTKEFTKKGKNGDSFDVWGKINGKRFWNATAVLCVVGRTVEQRTSTLVAACT